MFIIFFFFFNIVKEHYSSNKVRNAQVREDTPKARIEQELEKLKYRSYVQEQLV